MRRRIGEILRDLCKQWGVELLEGKEMPDHIHVVVSILRKFSVANTVGFLKEKSAVRFHRELMRGRRMTGLNSWAVEYGVGSVGMEENAMRRYVRQQSASDHNVDQCEVDFE